MKKLKKTSPFNILCLSLLVLSLIYSVIKIQTYPSSKYDKNANIVSGTITSYQIKEGYTKIKITGTEPLIINYSEEKEFKLGQKIKAQGEFKIPKENTTWNLFNYRKYLLSLNIKYTFSADKITILNKKISLPYQIKNKIISHINTFKSSSHLHAFILGNDDYLDETTKNSYQKNGITHLLAISGMNITLISAIILKIVNFFIKNKTISYLIVFLFLIFFLFLTGLVPSILRAICLFIILTINKQLNLKIKTIYLLILLFSLFLFVNPYYLYNLGFLLSFIISFYLIIFSKLISKSQSFLKELFTINIIAFLASTPLLIKNFFEINILSPVINCLFTPFVSLIIYPLSLLTLFLKPLDNTLFYLIEIMEKSSLFFSKINNFNIVLCSLPVFFYILYYILITCILIKWDKGKPLYTLLIIPTLLFHHSLSYLNPYTTLTMIDVGQGDSILIKLKHNKGNILIDTGGQLNYDVQKPYDLASNITIPYLKSEGISKLDYLIITHGDFDHAGMAENLINNFKVKNVITNTYSNELIENIKNLAKRKTIKFSQINTKILTISQNKFTFLEGNQAKDINDSSLIIYANLEGENILLMGDASQNVESHLLRTYNLPKMNILKVGHHGSRTSTSSKFINQIKPQISLISAGQNNIYSHPHKETLKTLKDSKVFVTKDDGSVKINLTTKAIITSVR